MHQTRGLVAAVAEVDRREFFAALVEREELKVGGGVVQPCHTLGRSALRTFWDDDFESAEVAARVAFLPAIVEPENAEGKENAMRRKRLARLLRKLRAMRKSLPKRDQLLLRIGAAKKEAGRAYGFVKIQMPAASQAVTRETFSFEVDKAKLKAAEQRDGHYLLRSNLIAEDPAVLWTRYVQLTQIESVFRSLKSELSIRPIRHQLEHRADAHVLIAFLAYCLQVTLKNRLMKYAPGLTPAAPAVPGVAQ